MRISPLGAALPPVRIDCPTSPQASARRGPGLRAVATLLLAFAVGSGGAVVGTSLVRAEGAADLAEILNVARFGRTPARPEAAERPAPKRSEARAARPASADRTSGRAGPLAEGRAPVRVAAAKAVMRGPETPVPALAGRRTVCVRLCDGYRFPVGDLRDRADLPVHQSACAAACPGAPVRLLTVEGGAPETARSPMAILAHQRSRVPSCSCQGADNVAARLPIRQDATLRRGDLFVTRAGAHVFTGPSRAAQGSFREFRTAGVLGRAERRQADELLGVTRRETVARAFYATMRVRVAAASRPEPAAAVTAASESAPTPAVVSPQPRPRRAFEVVEAASGFGEAGAPRAAFTTLR